MRSFLFSVLPLAGTAFASASASGDSDASVWDSLPSVSARAALSHKSNRPAKRQDGWAPPSELAAPLQEVWDHCLNTYSSGLFGFNNYGWDQLMATQG